MSIEPEISPRMLLAALLAVEGGTPPPDTSAWAAIITVCPPALLPYLWYRAQETGSERHIPSDHRKRLRATATASAAAALKRRHTFRQAVSILSAADIHPVALKGIYLDGTVYPRAGLRTMDDIDLWIPPGRLQSAVDALLADDFTFPARFPDGVHRPEQRERSIELMGSRGPIELLESLRSFAGLPPADADAMRDRARTVMLHGISVQALRHDDLLLHTVLNCSAKDLFDGSLRQMLDVALIVRHWREDWNWEDLARTHRHLGVDRWMYLSLHIARGLFQAPVPSSYFHLLAPPPHLDELEDLALEQIWSPESRLPQLMDDILVGRAGTSLVGRLVKRFGSHYVHGGSTSTGNLGSTALRAVRRLSYDLRIKVPAYIRYAWLGIATKSHRNRTRLALRRRRMNTLIAAGKPQPGAAPKNPMSDVADPKPPQ